jgi:TatD DNase family protein
MQKSEESFSLFRFSCIYKCILIVNKYSVQFVDTHSHIYLDVFDNDRSEVIERALQNEVKHIFLPNIDSGSIDRLHQVEQQFECCHAMMGLHPTSVKDNFIEELKVVESALACRPYAGIGEVGIDLYWDVTHRKQQIEAFELQVQWASQLDLPVIIHCRDAFSDVFEVLDRCHQSNTRGIFHSFSGSAADLHKIIDYQTFKVGINGIVTFKNSLLAGLLAEINPKWLVVETDAPFLAPAPHRGRRNEPGYVRLIASKLAEIYGITLEQMANQLLANTNEILNTKLIARGT